MKKKSVPKPGLGLSSCDRRISLWKNEPRKMDAAEEADRMVGTLNNVISELMSAKNKAQKHRDKLRQRGVEWSDVRSAKAEIGALAHSVDVAADGLESASEQVPMEEEE